MCNEMDIFFALSDRLGESQEQIERELQPDLICEEWKTPSPVSASVLGDGILTRSVTAGLDLTRTTLTVF